MKRVLHSVLDRELLRSKNLIIVRKYVLHFDRECYTHTQRFCPQNISAYFFVVGIRDSFLRTAFMFGRSAAGHVARQEFLTRLHANCVHRGSIVWENDGGYFRESAYECTRNSRKQIECWQYILHLLHLPHLSQRFRLYTVLPTGHNR